MSSNSSKVTVSEIAKHLFSMLSNKYVSTEDNMKIFAPDNKLFIDNSEQSFDSEESIKDWINNLGAEKKPTRWLNKKDFEKFLKKDVIMCTYVSGKGQNMNKICGCSLKTKTSNYLSESRCREHFGKEGAKLDMFIELQSIYEKINVKIVDKHIEYSKSSKTILKAMKKDTLKIMLTKIGININDSMKKDDIINCILEYNSN